MHPLDPVTADEFLAGRDILEKAGLLGDPVRFAYYGLEEPPKHDVLAGIHGQAGADRRLRAYLLNQATGESTDVVVSLGTDAVVSNKTLDPAVDGQLPIVGSEFAL